MICIQLVMEEHVCTVTALMMHKYMHAHIHTKDTYVRTYIHTYIHTHIQTYIHTVHTHHIVTQFVHTVQPQLAREGRGGGRGGASIRLTNVHYAMFAELRL